MRGETAPNNGTIVLGKLPPGKHVITLTVKPHSGATVTNWTMPAAQTITIEVVEVKNADGAKDKIGEKKG